MVMALAGLAAVSAQELDLFADVQGVELAGEELATIDGHPGLLEKRLFDRLLIEQRDLVGQLSQQRPGVIQSGDPGIQGFRAAEQGELATVPASYRGR